MKEQKKKEAQKHDHSRSHGSSKSQSVKADDSDDSSSKSDKKEKKEKQEKKEDERKSEKKEKKDDKRSDNKSDKKSKDKEDQKKDPIKEATKPSPEAQKSLADADKALANLGNSAAKGLEQGAASLTKLMPGLSNCDPTAMINGLLKMAKMAIGGDGCCPKPPKPDASCCHVNPNGPEEIVHLPGKDPVPLCKADPKAVVDALFPPLPAPKGSPADALKKAKDAERCAKCNGCFECNKGDGHGMAKLLHKMMGPSCPQPQSPAPTPIQKSQVAAQPFAISAAQPLAQPAA